MIENISLIEFVVGPLPNCPIEQIFTEKYKIKHVLYIFEVPEECANYFYGYLVKHLKSNVPVIFGHVATLYCKKEICLHVKPETKEPIYTIVDLQLFSTGNFRGSESKIS